MLATFTKILNKFSRQKERPRSRIRIRMTAKRKRLRELIGSLSRRCFKISIKELAEVKRKTLIMKKRFVMIE